MKSQCIALLKIHVSSRIASTVKEECANYLGKGRGEEFKNRGMCFVTKVKLDESLQGEQLLFPSGDDSDILTKNTEFLLTF